MSGVPPVSAGMEWRIRQWLHNEYVSDGDVASGMEEEEQAVGPDAGLQELVFNLFLS